MYVYFGEKIDVGHSSYLKGLSDYRNKISYHIQRKCHPLRNFAFTSFTFFFTLLSIPFLSTGLWYDFRE